MNTRRAFIRNTLYLAAGAAALPLEAIAAQKPAQQAAAKPVPHQVAALIKERGKKVDDGHAYTFRRDGVYYKGFVGKNDAKLELSFDQPDNLAVNAIDYAIDGKVEGGSYEAGGIRHVVIDGAPAEDLKKLQRWYDLLQDIFLQYGKY